MLHCTGQHQQYDSYEECLDYMRSLPQFDPICQHKIGPMAVQGNSYMCKYLHHFMTPFQPELHCYHSGRGRFDISGKRKCVPTDCLDANTPTELQPNLLPQVTQETIFVTEHNGTWTETLVSPETPRAAKKKMQDLCGDAEAAELAAATVLSLPFCILSLNTGACHHNCTQAVQTYLGRFAENGAVCRCNDGSDTKVMRSSAMLTKLRIDAKVLLEMCSRTLTTVEFPDCLGEFDSYPCPQVGLLPCMRTICLHFMHGICSYTYTGRGLSREGRMLQI